jgi:hypothetical protein
MTLSEGGPTRLVAGAASIDITPPLEVGLLMSSVDGRWAPFRAVRKPLFARALVLEGTAPFDPLAPHQRVAIVSLDLLALAGKAVGGFDSFKLRIVDAAEGVVAADDIVLACTHSHTAPESAAITDLYQTGAFRKWSRTLAESIGQAIAAAAAAMVPCELRYGSTQAPGLGVHRRIKTIAGIEMSHPDPPADRVISREGAVDDSVNVLWLSAPGGAVIAAVVNATCHPVYEMCNPEVSPDYPGEFCECLETAYPGAVALFLNGAAGNVNPPAVSAGAEQARLHGERLYAAVQDAASLAAAELHPVISLHRHVFELSSRLPDGQSRGKNVYASVSTLRIGQAALVFLPGEPFAETGHAIRAQSPFHFTAVVGFSEETIGYIPTDQAFVEGGYEIGFGAWSYLAPGCEPVVRRHAIRLLREAKTDPKHTAPSARGCCSKTQAATSLPGLPAQ